MNAIHLSCVPFETRGWDWKYQITGLFFQISNKGLVYDTLGEEHDSRHFIRQKFVYDIRWDES